MRVIFSLVALLLRVSIIGVLVKKQFGASPAVALPAFDTASTPAQLVGTLQQQLQQVQAAPDAAALPVRLAASEP